MTSQPPPQAEATDEARDELAEFLVTLHWDNQPTMDRKPPSWGKIWRARADKLIERYPTIFAQPAGGWVPIVLCPTDGVLRALRLSDGTEIAGYFDGPSNRLGASQRWKRRDVAYHNPGRIVGQRGGVDQWSEAYDTYIDVELPDGVFPTHFRPNDTVFGAPKATVTADANGDDDGEIVGMAPDSPPPPDKQPEQAGVVAWASSDPKRLNHLMSAAQYKNADPKNRVAFDVPLYAHPSPTPAEAAPEPNPLTEVEISEIMQATWNEFVADTGCYPDDLEIATTGYVTFKRGPWANHIAEAILGRLRAALAALE